MARLMLFVRRPSFLSGEEAARWMRDRVAPLAAVAGVEGLEITRLQVPSLRGATDWHWLIEMHCARGEDATKAAHDAACRDLVADLRLLGMQPNLVVADGAESLPG